MKTPPAFVSDGLLLLAAIVISAQPSSAQTITNPSFETDSFATFPGYVVDNGAITGWTGGPDTNYGLNPAAGSPFANNGVVPDGTNTAFLQRNDAGTFIRTEIAGVTDTQAYQLSFRATARGGQTPRIDVEVDGNVLLSSNVRAVGGTEPYTWVSVDFVASDTVADLRVVNSATAGDVTVNIDDFQIAPTTMPWTASAWNDDAGTEVDPAFFYTHAYNFGSGAGLTINEVPFTGVAGANPAVAGRFSTAGFDAVFANDPNNVTGIGAAMANDFVYNGYPASLTLEGLTPGTEYVLSVFSAGWEAPGGRLITFRSGDDVRSFDQDQFDNNNGIRFDYVYTAPAETVTVEFWPIQQASLHCYGFCNRETALIADTPPSFVIQPMSASASVGGSYTMFSAATGTRPITYQWYLDGVMIPGATGNSYVVNVTGAADAGFYHVEATNAFGNATSDAGFLQVFQPVPGLLFSTGLDATGIPLVGGADDPHYTLTTNPGGAAPIPAVVQTNIPGAWLANDGSSQWIGPSADTQGGAGGDYVYETPFDLTGLPPGVIITGRWATDNPGTAISVNGVAVPGVALSNGFGAFTDFTVDTGLLPPGTVTAGVNTLEFSLNNNGAGFTGLRVTDIAVEAIPAGIAPVVIEQPQSQSVTTGDTVELSVQAYGTAVLEYQWRKGGVDIVGADESTYTIASTTLADAGDYDVVVSNGEGIATSDIATLTALDAPPTITTQPQGGTFGTGEAIALSVVAVGSPTLTYQWKKDNLDIPGATLATLTFASAELSDSGSYSVVVTNPFGMDTSTAAVLTVLGSVPGLFNTGVDATGSPLADGVSDPHYTLTVNPDGAPLVPAVVHGSTAFPIVGPWLDNSATSKWVGPVTDTVASAAGDYSYATSFDLTGFDPDTVIITGQWASDNAGNDILINGVSTGQMAPGQFGEFADFTIDSDLQPGLNTLTFVLNNSAVGYTGLRVEGIRALGVPAPVIPLPEPQFSINGAGNPAISFVGVEGVEYRFQRSTSLADGAWSDIGGVTAPPGGLVNFEDTMKPPGRAFYRVVVVP